jgi:hypothetical protein
MTLALALFAIGAICVGQAFVSRAPITAAAPDIVFDPDFDRLVVGARLIAAPAAMTIDATSDVARLVHDRQATADGRDSEISAVAESQENNVDSDQHGDDLEQETNVIPARRAMIRFRLPRIRLVFRRGTRPNDKGAEISVPFQDEAPGEVSMPVVASPVDGFTVESVREPVAATGVAEHAAIEPTPQIQPAPQFQAETLVVGPKPEIQAEAVAPATSFKSDRKPEIVPHANTDPEDVLALLISPDTVDAIDATPVDDPHQARPKEIRMFKLWPWRRKNSTAAAAFDAPAREWIPSADDVVDADQRATDVATAAAQEQGDVLGVLSSNDALAEARSHADEEELPVTDELGISADRRIELAADAARAAARARSQRDTTEEELPVTLAPPLDDVTTTAAAAVVAANAALAESEARELLASKWACEIAGTSRPMSVRERRRLLAFYLTMPNDPEARTILERVVQEDHELSDLAQSALNDVAA